MQPDKVDFTVRWDTGDYQALQEVAANMRMSTAAVVRWATINWLREQREVPARWRESASEASAAGPGGDGR